MSALVRSSWLIAMLRIRNPAIICLLILAAIGHGVRGTPADGIIYAAHQSGDVFRCPSASGDFASTKLLCSTSYYQCHDWMPQKLYCAAGKIFDAVDLVCRLLEELPHCQFDCRDKPSQSMHPLGCTKFFWWCWDGLPTKQSCKDGRYFNPANNQCDFREKVAACEGKPDFIETPGRAAPGATAPTLPPRPSSVRPSLRSEKAVNCSTLKDGNYPDPSGACSVFYYTCSNHHTFRQSCSRGLVYNGNADQCQRREEMAACDGSAMNPHGQQKPAYEEKAGKKLSDQPIKEQSPEDLTYSYKDIERAYYHQTIEHIYPIDCTKLPDGKHADPTASCAGHFYVCEDTKASIRYCQENLYYDAQKGECRRWNVVPKCGINEALVKPTYAPAKAPIKAALGISPDGEGLDCSNAQDGNYANPLAPCSNIFFTCTNFIRITRPCPEDLYYDDGSDQCLRRNEVPACGGLRPNKASQAASAPSMCLQPNGIFAHPYYMCNRAYIICTNGQWTVAECQNVGEIFNPNKSACTNARQVPGCDSDFCQGREHGGRHPVPFGSQCTSNYVVCVHGAAVYQPCPSPLIFSSATGNCEWAVDVPACGIVRRTHEIYEDKPAFIEEVAASSRNLKGPKQDSNLCQALPEGDHALKPCASSYVTCSNKQVYKRECPSSLVFDASNKQCDLPADLIQCRPGTKPQAYPVHIPAASSPNAAPKPTAKAPAAIIPPQPPVKEGINQCLSLPDGDHATAPCARSYRTCSNTYEYKRECPFGLVFDDANKRCDNPGNVPQCGSSGPNPQPYPVPPRIPSTPSPSVAPKPTPKAHQPIIPPQPLIKEGRNPCQSLPDGDYAIDKCGPSYRTCSNYYAHERKCQHGLVFNGEKKQCDHRGNVPQCSSGLIQPPYPAHIPAGLPTAKPTTKKALLQQPPKQGPNPCQSRPDGDYAIEPCSNFYQTCSNNYPFKRQCQHGLVFNGEKKQCDHRGNVPQCGSGPIQPPYPAHIPAGLPTAKPTTKKAPSQQPPKQGPNPCQSRPDGDYAIGPCSNFYQTCSNNYPFKRQCQPGLIFNDEKKWCDNPGNMRQCGSAKPHPYPGIAPTKAPLKPPEYLPQRTTAPRFPPYQEHRRPEYPPIQSTTTTTSRPLYVQLQPTVTRSPPLPHVVPQNPVVKQPTAKPPQQYRSQAHPYVAISTQRVEQKTQQEKGGISYGAFVPGHHNVQQPHIGHTNTREQSPTPAPNVPQIEGGYCQSLTDGQYPYGICSRIYISCIVQSTHIFQCPGGLVFDSGSKYCASPSTLRQCASQTGSVYPFQPPLTPAASGLPQSPVFPGVNPLPRDEQPSLIPIISYDNFEAYPTVAQPHGPPYPPQLHQFNFQPFRPGQHVTFGNQIIDQPYQPFGEDGGHYQPQPPYVQEGAVPGQPAVLPYFPPGQDQHIRTVHGPDPIDQSVDAALCEGIADGYYSIQPCSQVYVHCDSHIAKRSACAFGYVFNNDTKHCENATTSIQCVGRIVETIYGQQSPPGPNAGGQRPRYNIHHIVKIPGQQYPDDQIRPYDEAQPSFVPYGSDDYPSGTQYPAEEQNPFGNEYPFRQQYPSRIPTGEKYPFRIPTGENDPSRIPTGGNYPSRIPTGESYPSRIPTGENYPSRIPTGENYPSRIPTGERYPFRIPTGENYPSRHQYPGQQFPSGQSYPSGHYPSIYGISYTQQQGPYLYPGGNYAKGYNYYQEGAPCSGENEIYTKCGTACEPTCNDPQPACNQPCVAGCHCNAGYVRSYFDDSCIPASSCSTYSGQTAYEVEKNLCYGPNEIYKTCASCQPTCSNPRPYCSDQHCASGCACRAGYVRSSGNRCVLRQFCSLYSNTINYPIPGEVVIDEGDSCGDGDDCGGGSSSEEKCPHEYERYDDCQAWCQPTCEEPNLNCTERKKCVPGCVCLDGFVRSLTGVCINATKCYEIPQQDGNGNCTGYNQDCQSEESTETSEERKYKDFCVAKETGTYKLGSCSSTYIYCKFQVAHVLECPDCEIFNGDRCASCWSVKNCKSSCKKKLHCRPPVLNPHGYEQYDDIIRQCQHRPDGNYVLSPCTADYLQCHQGHVHQRRCDDGYVYSDEYSSCVPGSHSPCGSAPDYGNPLVVAPAQPYYQPGFEHYAVDNVPAAPDDYAPIPYRQGRAGEYNGNVKPYNPKQNSPSYDIYPIPHGPYDPAAPPVPYPLAQPRPRQRFHVDVNGSLLSHHTNQSGSLGFSHYQHGYPLLPSTYRQSALLPYLRPPGISSPYFIPGKSQIIHPLPPPSPNVGSNIYPVHHFPVKPIPTPFGFNYQVNSGSSTDQNQVVNPGASNIGLQPFNPNQKFIYGSVLQPVVPIYSHGILQPAIPAGAAPVVAVPPNPAIPAPIIVVPPTHPAVPVPMPAVPPPPVVLPVPAPGPGRQQNVDQGTAPKPYPAGIPIDAGLDQHHGRVVVNLDGPCRGLVAGSLVSFGKCKREYAECVDGVAVPKTCAKIRYIYDDVTKTCIDRNDEPLCRTMPPPPKPKAPTGELAQFCLHKDNGYYGHPSNCTKFIQCHEKNTYEFKCSMGLVFNANEGVKACDYPRNVPECVDPDLGTGIDHECEDVEDGAFLRHPTDCAKYLRCVHGKLQEQPCPGGLVFNINQNVCDYEKNVPDCKPY